MPREPFIYEGRIKLQDADGEYEYASLSDAPRKNGWPPDLMDSLLEWLDPVRWQHDPELPRLRITIEEIESEGVRDSFGVEAG